VKILCVAGSRGERVKLAPVIAALEGEHVVTFVAISRQGRVPTWDAATPPAEDLSLTITEGTPALRAGAVVRWMEFIVEERRPDILVTCGGSDAAVGASLMASLNGVAQGHLDAGVSAPPPADLSLRFLDQASTFLLAPHAAAAERLARQGMEDSAFMAGDTLADAPEVTVDENAASEPYCVCYLGGRMLDSPDLPVLFSALADIGMGVLLPAADEARRRFQALPSPPAGNVRVTEALDYGAMQEAIARARLVITDSPTVQRESVFRGTVALGLGPADFPEAERAGWIRVVALDEEAIAAASKAPQPEEPFDVEAHRGSGVRAARFLTGL
jgi:UDP-N-acetylglucosamine 2-epimerase